MLPAANQYNIHLAPMNRRIPVHPRGTTKAGGSNRDGLLNGVKGSGAAGAWMNGGGMEFMFHETMICINLR